MKHIPLFFLLITSTLSTMAHSNASFTDTGRITSIEPIYRQHNIQKPYQDCYTKTVYEPASRGSDSSATNELLGGILGGALGNQFGGGSGKEALTVAGALLGASIANDMESAPTLDGGRYVDKRICETKYDYITENRLSHYKVSYEYKEKTYSYQAKSRPISNTVRVRVNIAPITN